MNYLGSCESSECIRELRRARLANDIFYLEKKLGEDGENTEKRKRRKMDLMFKRRRLLSLEGAI